MTFLTPRKLSNLAAKVFVEDLILESQLFIHFPGIKLLMSDHNKKNSDKFGLECNVKELKESMRIIVSLMDEILVGCSPDTMQCILEVLRTTDHYCFSGAIILQLLYDTEVNFCKRNWRLFSVLNFLQQSYITVEKLVFDSVGESRIIAFLCQFLQYLPNLKIFKGIITKEVKFLTSLRNNCPKLTHLALYITEGCFTSSQLTLFYFCGKSLDYIKKAYIKLEDVPLSFPYLESFSMSGISFEQYDFFKMFVHFYTNVNFCVSLHYPHLCSSSVSWFDAVLSHSVVINPDISMNKCELNVYDLFLPFCEKSLRSWKNLESLLISLGVQGKKIPATSTNIGKRLESLLANLERVRELCIRVQGPINEDEVSEILYPSLKAHGSRFKQLKVFGAAYFLSHRSLVHVFNLCPNVRQATLFGKRIAKYFKDVKLKSLSSLESLTVIWSETQTNPSFCHWVSKFTSDLIKSSANLKYLYCTANINLMEHLHRLKFGAEIENLVIYFHTEKSCDGVVYLKKILPRLPKLKQLVVKESHVGKTCECYLEKDGICICDAKDDAIIYNRVKSCVDKTQVYLRYYTFEDAQIAMYL